MSLGRKVTHAVSWLAVAQVAQRATTLVVTAILARRLLPADFGLIALTLLTVTFISYFQDMGLSAALVQRPNLEKDHLNTAFWVNVGGGLVLGLLGVALSPLISTLFREDRLTKIVMVMMITLPINGLGWASHSLLQRRLTFKTIAVVEWLSMFLSGVGAITLALLGAGVWALVAQNIISSVVSASGRLFAARWLPGFSFSKQSFRELFSFSSGALGYFLVNHGMRNLDKAIIGSVLGATALGFYSIAYNLILMPGMTICSLVGRVMFPALSSLQHDLVRFRRAYLRMARTVAFATFPLIIGLAATAKMFITTIYSDRWAPSVPIVQILVIIGFFEAIAIWGAAAWALGNTRMSLICAIISLCVMSIAFGIGVHWGLPGVAWAYVITSPIVFLLPHLWTNRLMGLRLGTLVEAIAPPFCAAGVMGMAVWLLISDGVRLFGARWANLLGYIVLGGVIYALALLVMAVVYSRQHGMLSWLIGRHLTEVEAQPQGAPS
ncbi:MAG: lipopolysaccharide biosynthesis protein [Acidobacteriota bacterium]|nr:lipopolysaccharide biosynthesis protein [Acidobacteriota bacterium]